MRPWSLLVGGLSLVVGTVAQAASPYNMTPGVTPISQEIYDLHMTIFWICVAIGVVVFSVLIYSLVKHRKSKGAVASQFHEHLGLEILWAIIPFIILVLMAIPATRVLIDMDDTSDADINIKVTGYQWKWQYEYLDEGISFFSNLSTPRDQISNKEKKGEHYLLEVDNPLIVPVHRKVRFLVTAHDVIHSWWVPALGVKRDGVPGFIHESWAKIEKPGIYRGQCAELCGVNHGFMPIVVKAVSETEYQHWVASHKASKQAASAQVNKTFSKEELMQKGEQAYNTVCAVCHKPGGEGMPPAFPALKGAPITTGPVAEHIDVVLNGKPGTAMQAFGAQLDDTTIAAVITYERSAWGNDSITKDTAVVQPKAVQTVRKK